MSVVPGGKVPEGEDKVNLKNLYEMFPYTSSHGLISIQFLVALGIFFGAGVKETKNAITELYKILSYASLSGTRDFNFDAIFEFISRLSLSIKKSTLTKKDRKKKMQKRQKK